MNGNGKNLMEVSENGRAHESTAEGKWMRETGCTGGNEVK